MFLNYVASITLDNYEMSTVKVDLPHSKEQSRSREGMQKLISACGSVCMMEIFANVLDT